MSETDDTDVLLLIPPNFFLVHSSESDNSLLESSRTVVHKPTSCTAQVLGKLVNQVHSLESRLDTLELSTASDISYATSSRIRCKTWDTDSLDSHSVGRKCSTFPRRRKRKLANKLEKKRDLSLTSLDTVSSDKVPPLRLTDNANITLVDTKNILNSYYSHSMDGDISSIVSTPSKKNDKLLLHEIDEFLTKVEAYESPESKYKTQDTLSPENLIKATGDYMSEKLDSKNTVVEVKLPSGRTVPSNILDRYIYLVKNNLSSSQTQNLTSGSSYKNENSRQEDVSKNLENLRNLSDKSQSARKLNFSEKEVQPTSTPKRLTQATSYSDTFRPSTNKIYDRVSKVVEQYKSQSSSRMNQNSVTDTSSISPKTHDFKVPEFRPYSENKRNTLKPTAMEHKLMESIDTDLLSLSELWGEKGERMYKLDNVKLEEERLKREHCEAMIQQLQKKVLDQQEKIAVAIKVDRGKDAAITKLKEAWLKLTHSLDRAEERHRAALDKMVTEVDNFKMMADEAQKKTNHFEAELYKALDLAHDYQEKCKKMTEEKKEMQDTLEKTLFDKEEVIKGKDKEIEMLKENYETIMRLNKQSTDCSKSLEENLEKEKTEHELSKNKINELNRKLESANEELSIVHQERDLLKDKVNEERARCNILERQLCEKQNQCSELLKKCDTLGCEVKSVHKHLELQKNELKTHYQKQLEDAVLGKLQEFQHQLDRAEREMETEARARENNIVDTFNKQVARIEEQHKLEINVLEEKQKEEIKLYRLQLAQASEKISLLEGKLSSLVRRRGVLAAQLHAVMEAQWRRALSLLTEHHPPATTAPQGPQGPQGSTGSNQDYELSAATPPQPLPAAALGAAPGAAPGAGLAARAPAARDLNFEALSDHELQQYVQLLLSKPPSFEVSGDHIARDINEEPTSDRPDKLERRDRAKRTLYSNKPPWKA